MTSTAVDGGGRGRAPATWATSDPLDRSALPLFYTIVLGVTNCNLKIEKQSQEISGFSSFIFIFFLSLMVAVIVTIGGFPAVV